MSINEDVKVESPSNKRKLEEEEKSSSASPSKKFKTSDAARSYIDDLASRPRVVLQDGWLIINTKSDLISIPLADLKWFHIEATKGYARFQTEDMSRIEIEEEAEDVLNELRVHLMMIFTKRTQDAEIDAIRAAGDRGPARSRSPCYCPDGHSEPDEPVADKQKPTASLHRAVAFSRSPLLFGKLSDYGPGVLNL